MARRDLDRARGYPGRRSLVCPDKGDVERLLSAERGRRTLLRSGRRGERTQRASRAELPPYYAERLEAIRPATAVSVRRKAVALDSETEALRLFRDFKLGLLTLVVVALLLLAYFWDGGREGKGPPGGGEEGVLTMQLRGERRSEVTEPPLQPRSAGLPQEAYPPQRPPAPSRPRRPEPVAERRSGRAGVAPSAVAPATGRVASGRADPKAFVYAVRSGDTLSAIALRFYGKAGSWPLILTANRTRLRRPSDLRAGMRILVPAKARGRVRAEVPGALRVP